MEDCIFCSIAAGRIPAKVLYEDDDVLAFADASPQAPVHALVIPKRHVANLLEAAGSLDDRTLAALLRVVARVAREQGLEETGFRVISNCGRDACQSVQHLHLHVLGGKEMPAEMV